MPRTLRALAVAGVVTAGATIAGCGEHGIQLAHSDPNRRGAQIFFVHCSGCHTLSPAGTEGSATNVRTREYKDGPNFNARKETVKQVLYAIQNGGFSSGPMPQDIVTGRAAQQVAQFVAKYSGREAARPVTPPTGTPQGFNGGGSSQKTGGGNAPKGSQGSTNP